MARDVRQVVAGLLTGSMLIMLCNMVKRDHFDPIYVVRIMKSLLSYFNY